MPLFRKPMEKKRRISKDMPLDITENIFSRLPGKSLLKFRSACKAWCTLIDRATFADMLYNQSEAKNAAKLVLWPSRVNLTLLHLKKGKKKKKVRSELIPLLDYDTTLHCLQLIGSCNGLLFLSHRNTKGSNSTITVVNPLTRKFKDVRFNIDQYQRNQHDRTGNWWPSKENLYAVWYDKEEKEYKIIVIEFPFPWGVNVIAYSFTTKSWSRIKEKIPYDLTYCTSAGVLVNGALHWIASCITSYKKIIFAFNCTTNCLYELPLPVNGGSEMSLTEIRGQLYLICNYYGLIERWVMEDYAIGGSWVKLPRYISVHDLNNYGLNAYTLLLHGVKEDHVRKIHKKEYIDDYTDICACVESVTSIDIDR